MFNTFFYHPALDVNHCLFRTVTVALHAPNPLSVELHRIIDFYLLFPHTITNIVLPKQLSNKRRLLKEIPESYTHIGSIRKAFYRLRRIQTVTYQNMASRSVICLDTLRGSRTILLNKDMLSEKMIRLCSDNRYTKERWFQFLTIDLPSIKFTGEGGLKDRTSLLPHHHDT